MARVLVVDDEPDLRWIVRFLIEELGHDVVEAPNGAEGLRELEQASFDLVLSDLNMPVMHGQALRDEVRRRWPDTRFVLWSHSRGAEVDGRPVEDLHAKGNVGVVDFAGLLSGRAAESVFA